MAGESAGEIYVEIRAKLDSLQADVNKVNSAFARIETQTAGVNNKIVNSFSKVTDKFSKLGGIVKALPVVGALTLIGGAVKGLTDKIGEYINKTAETYHKQQKSLATLNALVQTTGASAWTSSKQLNTMADALSKATGYATDDITKMQGRILTYTNIIGDTFNRTSKAALDMAAVMGMDAASAAETLGKALDSPIEGLTALTRQGFRFKDAIKDQIEALTAQGDIAGAQAVILNEVERAYSGVASAQNNTASKTERLKKVQEELNAEIGRTTSKFTNLGTSIKLAWKESVLFEMRQRRIGESAKNSEKDIASYTKNVNDLKASLDELIANGADDERIIKIKVQIEEAEKELKDKKENVDEASDRVAYWKKQLDALESYRNTIREVEEAKKAAVTQMIENEKSLTIIFDERRPAIILELENAKERIRLREKDIAELKEKFRYEQEMLILAQKDLSAAEEAQRVAIENDRIEKKAAAEKLALKPLEDALTEAIKKRRDALLAAGVAASNGRIDAEEFSQRVKNAYTEEANQITVIRQQIRDLSVETEEGEARKREAIYKTTRALTEAADLEKQRTRIAADNSMNDKIKDLRFEYKQLTGTIEEVKEAEKQRAWEMIENSADYKNASEDVKTAVKAAFDDVYNHADAKNPWDKMKEKMQQYGSAVQNIISGALDLYASLVRKAVDEELKEAERLYKANLEFLEKNHQAKLEYLEKEKQAKLYARGYIEAQTEEQHQRELELAIESGDQQRIYEAHNAHERFLIEEEYKNNKEAQDLEYKNSKEALERDMAQTKAELDYKAALANWHVQLLNSIISTAGAVSMAGINMWPLPAIPMMAMAATTGTLQQALILANKPKMQTFAEGGIVSGNSFRGDNMLVRANSEEMFLNRRQQRNMFDAIDNNELGSGNPIIVENKIYLDGVLIAKNSVTHINNRQAGMIDGRSVAL